MIRTEHIVKSFDGRRVLDDISIEFETGKTNLIIGRSGSGKTVLLKTLVGLHEPDAGSVWYDDVNFTALGFRERKSIRRDIGMIFQGGALLDSSTVEENVKLPLDLFTEQSEREKMERILNAGRYAATAKNTQGCRFLFFQKDLEAFKDLVWEEMPGIVAGLKETLPAYARLFEFFCLRRKRDPKDDPLFFNTTSFLVITAKDLLDGGLAAANIENMAVAEGAGVLYSGYLMRVIKASARLKEWLGITEEEQIACCMLMGYPAVSYRRTAPRREGQIEWR